MKVNRIVNAKKKSLALILVMLAVSSESQAREFYKAKVTVTVTHNELGVKTKTIVRKSGDLDVAVDGAICRVRIGKQDIECAGRMRLRRKNGDGRIINEMSASISALPLATAICANIEDCRSLLPLLPNVDVSMGRLAETTSNSADDTRVWVPKNSMQIDVNAAEAFHIITEVSHVRKL